MTTFEPEERDDGLADFFASFEDGHSLCFGVTTGGAKWSG